MLSDVMTALVEAIHHKSRGIFQLFGVKNATKLIERIDGVRTVGDGSERSVEPTIRTSPSVATKSSPYEPGLPEEPDPKFQ